MADGFLCANCGWQETEHEVGNDSGEKYVRGYKNSLANCPGFQLSRKDERISRQIHHLSKADLEYMERQAEGRAAFSLYGAIQRQLNFNEKLASLPDKERPAFIEKCRRNNNTLIIG